MAVDRRGRAVTKVLVWDREAGIGGTGRPTPAAAAFAGTLAARIVLAPRHDPEFKGIVERGNGYLETSFLPGRSFCSPSDFNAQLGDWLSRRANQRTVRAIGARPVEVLETDHAAMTPLPPVDPPVGLCSRVRLARDYYVRVDGNDYSVDPHCIGRFVDVTASPSSVTVFCDGQVVARHDRCWARHDVVRDPAHVAAAAVLRREHQQRRETARLAQQREQRRHADGHTVVLRALPDYDALFGIDPDTFTAPARTPARTSSPEATSS